MSGAGRSVHGVHMVSRFIPVLLYAGTQGRPPTFQFQSPNKGFILFSSLFIRNSCIVTYEKGVSSIHSLPDSEKPAFQDPKRISLDTTLPVHSLPLWGRPPHSLEL